ncbi:MAG: hypothetical protein ACYCTC_12420, partial [Acidithiobacillus ferrooxidans]
MQRCRIESKNWCFFFKYLGFDGKEIKPKTGGSFSNTWILNGKEVKTKTGASFSNTWVIQGNEAKPKVSASSSTPGVSLVVAAKLERYSRKNTLQYWDVMDADQGEWRMRDLEDIMWMQA